MQREGARICSLGNISANVKGTHEYDSLKELQWKVLKKGTKNFFEKMFFDQKPSRNLNFWPFLIEKMADKKIWSKNFFSRNRFRIVQNVFLNKNLDYEKNFPLWLDMAIFSKNGVTCRKMAKTKIFGQENFFGRNRFRMVQNVFQN